MPGPGTYGVRRRKKLAQQGAPTPAPAPSQSVLSQILSGGGGSSRSYQPSTVPASQLTQRTSTGRVPSPGVATRGPRAQAPKPRTREEKETLLEQLDRPFGPNETITPEQTALLAEAYGLPGITYSQAIVPGESGYRPGVRNPDDDTPSLFQITPSVQSPATQAKFAKIASKHRGGYSNPVAAAKQAAFLARGSADEGVSNYVAYNPSAPQGHLPGGSKRARKVLGMPASGATGRRGLSVNELFYDPGINIADGQPTSPIGGHDTHVHFGSESGRDVLKAAQIAQRRGLDVRENPLFDPVDPVHTEGSMHYSTTQLGQGKRIPRKYRGEEIGTAIDVTGSPDELAAYDQAIARRSGAALTSSGSSYAGPTGGVSTGVPSSGGSTSDGSGALQRLLSGQARSARARPLQNPLAARAPQPGERRRRSYEDEEETEIERLLAELGGGY